MQDLEIKKAISSLKLIDGVFTPSSTSDLLKGFINEKINYHKVQKLMLTEANHSDTTPFDNSRINELKNDLIKLYEAVEFARENNKKFKLNATINIELVD